MEGIGDDVWHHLLDLLPFHPAVPFISTDPRLAQWVGWGRGAVSKTTHTPVYSPSTLHHCPVTQRKTASRSLLIDMSTLHVITKLLHHSSAGTKLYT